MAGVLFRAKLLLWRHGIDLRIIEPTQKLRCE
jgi:hypothetical protein